MPPVLRTIREWLDTSMGWDRELTWVVASMELFEFISLGELLPENEAAYAQATYLRWRGVATDNLNQPMMLKIHLK